MNKTYRLVRNRRRGALQPVPESAARRGGSAHGLAVVVSARPHLAWRALPPLAALALATGLPGAHADVAQWTGTTSSDWFTDSNWTWALASQPPASTGTITGLAGTWNNPGSLFIGREGTGILNGFSAIVAAQHTCRRSGSSPPAGRAAGSPSPRALPSAHGPGNGRGASTGSTIQEGHIVTIMT